MKNAHKVKIERVPERNYSRKSVLRIYLPKASQKVRFTICLLLNEVFKTTYPDQYHYIFASMTDLPEGDGYEKELLYRLEIEKKISISENDVTEGENAEELSSESEKEYIYIIEDSEIDIGLLSSFERNIERFFGIITEYIMWNTGKKLQKAKIEKADNGDFDDEYEEEEDIVPEENVEPEADAEHTDKENDAAVEEPV